MDWYLHRQVIGRLGPLLLIVPLPWILAAYFYIDPLVALGIIPISKASWGEFPYASYLRVAHVLGIAIIGGALGPYLAVYWRARRGERISPAPLSMYLLMVGGVVAGASVYVVLKFLPSA